MGQCFFYPSGQLFHPFACHCCVAFFSGGVREIEQFQNALAELLGALGANPRRTDVEKTPQRVARALGELMDGQDAAEEDLTSFDAPAYNHWVEMYEIPFGSLCEHHLLPFVGKISLAHWPQDGHVIGLSKLESARSHVIAAARRPTGHFE